MLTWLAIGWALCSAYVAGFLTAQQPRYMIEHPEDFEGREWWRTTASLLAMTIFGPLTVAIFIVMILRAAMRA